MGCRPGLGRWMGLRPGTRNGLGRRQRLGSWYGLAQRQRRRLGWLGREPVRRISRPVRSLWSIRPVLVTPDAGIGLTTGR